MPAEAVREARAISRADADLMDVCCRRLIGMNAGQLKLLAGFRAMITRMRSLCMPPLKTAHFGSFFSCGRRGRSIVGCGIPRTGCQGRRRRPIQPRRCCKLSTPSGRPPDISNAVEGSGIGAKFAVVKLCIAARLPLRFSIRARRATKDVDTCEPSSPGRESIKRPRARMGVCTAPERENLVGVCDAPERENGPYWLR